MMSGLQVTWLRRAERGPEARPLLAIEDLAVRVGVRLVLDGVDLEVHVGDHVRITGPNGCGKSTLLNAIAGVGPARIERGQIRFDGISIVDWPAHERARRGMAYMRQVDSIFPTLTIAENLTMALGKNGFKLFAEAFPEWARDLAQDKVAGQLSGGQRKKLSWAMTVLKKGVYLVLLDEPRAGLHDSQKNLLDLSEKTTMLEVEHEH